MHNLKITLRHLRKHKGYSLLNITVLAVGLACFGLIAMFIAHEISYDQHIPGAQDIYRVTSKGRGLSVSREPQPLRPIKQTPNVLATQLLPNLPELVAATRIDPDMHVVTTDRAQGHEEHFYQADPAVMDVFSLSLLYGDPATLFAEPNNVVLTRAMAEKYFGDANAIGQTLYAAQNIIGVQIGAGVRGDAYTVSGVIENYPATTTVAFDFLVPIKNDNPDSWDELRYFTYARLQTGASPDSLNAKLVASYLEGKPARGFSSMTDFQWERLPDIYFESPWGGENGKQSDRQYLYIFLSGALLLLLIAGLSYTNQALALALTRTREVALRKVVGASRFQLVRLYFMEALVMVVLATAMAIGLMVLALPLFNELAGKTLTFDLLPVNRETLLVLGGGLLAISVLVGAYPALFLSKFLPIDVLMHWGRGGTSAVWLRRSLLVVQAAFAMGLVMLCVVLYQQMTFIQEKNLGFEQANLVAIRLETDVRPQSAALKEEVLAQPGVLAATRTSGIPVVPERYLYGKSDEDPNPRALHRIYVDEDFLATFDIALVDGRNFEATDRPGSRGAGIKSIVNQTRAAAFEDGIAVGQPLVERGRSEIIGVMEDFHFASLHQQIRPFAIQFSTRNPSYLTVRLAPGSTAATLELLAETYERVAPGEPFSFFFLDDRIDALYRAEQRMTDIMMLFAGLLCSIALLSLTSIVAFSVTRRTREIGIRKVLGASVTRLVVLLGRSFSLQMAIAIALAAPAAYYLADQWLMNFAYRIELNSHLLAWSAGGGLLTMWLVIGLRTLRAALMNPAEVLRVE